MRGIKWGVAEVNLTIDYLGKRAQEVVRGHDFSSSIACVGILLGCNLLPESQGTES